MELHSCWRRNCRGHLNGKRSGDSEGFLVFAQLDQGGDISSTGRVLGNVHGLCVLTRAKK